MKSNYGTVFAIAIVSSMWLTASTPLQAGLFDNLTAAKNNALGITNVVTTNLNAANLSGIPANQLAQGLKDALASGLQHAVTNLGHAGGFLTNASVKIPMPERLLAVEKTLRSMGQSQLADQFVTTMNSAAEQAVPLAASVFVDALKQMSVDDAKNILSGPDNSATLYFQKTTRTNLYTKFYPIVKKTTEQTGVTAEYKNLLATANNASSFGGFGSKFTSGLLDKDSLDIDAYVSNKALDGLFKMVADEEKQIRQNPMARTTDALKQVFGALQK